MKSPIKRTASSFQENGRNVTEVELATGQLARLLTEDYARLCDLGIPPNWNFNGNGNGLKYVCGQSDRVGERGRGLIRIARLIARAKGGEVVRYRDGDSLNLMPENLVIERGHSFGRELEALA